MVASLAVAAVLINVIYTDSVGAGRRRTVIGVHIAEFALVTSLAVAGVSEVLVDASAERALVLHAVVHINCPNKAR